MTAPDHEQAEREVRMLLASKHHCSPELSKAGRELLDRLAAQLAEREREIEDLRALMFVIVQRHGENLAGIRAALNDVLAATPKAQPDSEKPRAADLHPKVLEWTRRHHPERLRPEDRGAQPDSGETR